MAKRYKHGWIIRNDDGSYYWEDVYGVVRGEDFSSVQECVNDIDEDQKYTSERLAVH